MLKYTEVYFMLLILVNMFLFINSSVNMNIIGLLLSMISMTISTFGLFEKYIYINFDFIPFKIVMKGT